VNGADGGGVPQTDLPLDIHPDEARSSDGPISDNPSNNLN